MKAPLSRIAHARSGDKGDLSNIGVVALTDALYPVLVREVTVDRVRASLWRAVPRADRALRAAEPWRAQFPAPRGARRRRHRVAAHRRTGEDIQRAAAHARNRCRGVGTCSNTPVTAVCPSVTLARPEKRNALSSALLGELLAALRAANADASVGAILLDAEGPAFSAGMDLDEAPGADAAALAQLHADVFAIRSELTKPLVAAVQGAAFGGSVGLDRERPHCAGGGGRAVWPRRAAHRHVAVHGLAIGIGGDWRAPRGGAGADDEGVRRGGGAGR